MKFINKPIHPIFIFEENKSQNQHFKYLLFVTQILDTALIVFSIKSLATFDI